jgi:hypothetical protein
MGDVTVEGAFNVESLGIGPDEVAGYPLLSVYLTGKDLKNAFEVDASVVPLSSSAQLFFSGATFTFNPNRMIFNKVTDCAQVLEDGSRVPIDENRLYRVVTGLYCGQMLGTVTDKSFGILSITPRDANGNVVTDFDQYILHNPDGTEVKEWYALASYLQNMGTVDQRYAAPEGRKVVDASWNPVKLLQGANHITYIALVVIALLVVAIVFIARAVRRAFRHGKVHNQ